MRDIRILVSNDDGIHAPGLKAMEKIARTISRDVWVVCPDSEQSGASHSLTLSEPLRIRPINRRRYAVSGTPTDCVMLALNTIIKGRRPDLVLSGVNRGGNLGEDVTYSGTIAAAMEGTLLGVPSIALSQCFGWTTDRRVPWDNAVRHAPPLIDRLLDIGWPRDCLINVNFPDCTADEVTGIEVTVQGRRDVNDLLIDQRTDARGNDYYWLGLRRAPFTPPEGTDLAAMHARRISVTPLHLDLTHFETRKALAAALSAPLSAA
jgi:5'-nucleotidase